MKNFKGLFLFAFAIVLLSSCSKTEQTKNPVNQKSPQGNSSYMQSGGGSGNKIQLKLNLKNGSEYNLKMFTEQKISQTIMKEKQVTIQNIGVSYTYKVEGVDSDGSMNLKVIYNSFLQDVQSAAGRMTYNSTNPKDKDNPFAKIYEALINKSFNLKLSPQGNVVNISGVDALLKTIIKNLKLPNAEAADMAEKSLREQFGDKAVRESMQNMMSIYPQSPVSPGDSWSKSYSTSKIFNANFDTKWTLKEVKDGKAIVIVSSKIKGVPPKKSENGMPVPKYNISGEQSGILELDVASGWVSKAKINQKLGGKVELDKTEQTEAISIPLSIESTITMEAVK